jgi:hypothetical protein
LGEELVGKGAGKKKGDEYPGEFLRLFVEITQEEQKFRKSINRLS